MRYTTWPKVCGPKLKCDCWTCPWTLMCCYYSHYCSGVSIRCWIAAGICSPSAKRASVGPSNDAEWWGLACSSISQRCWIRLKSGIWRTSPVLLHQNCENYYLLWYPAGTGDGSLVAKVNVAIATLDNDGQSKIAIRLSPPVCRGDA